MTPESIFLFIPLIVFFFSIFVILQGFKQVNENQRAVVFRLGQFRTVLNPGLNIVIPFLDKAIYVNLSTHLPEWQGLEKEEVNKRVKDLVCRDPDAKKYK